MNAHRRISRLTGRTLFAVSWTLAGTVAQVVVRLGSTAILVRLLSPADFGLIGTGLVIVSLAQIIAELGINHALIQKLEVTDAHLRTCAALSVASFSAVALLMWAGAGLAADLLHLPALEAPMKLLALLLPIRALGSVPSAMLQRELRFRAVSIVNFGAYAAGTVTAIGAALAGFGTNSLVMSQIVESALTTVLFLILHPRGWFPRFDKAAARDLIHYGGGMTLLRLTSFFALQGDYLITSRFLGAHAMGLYSRAYQLLALPAQLFTNAIEGVLFSSMSKIQNDPERLARAFRRQLAATSLLVLPVSALLWVLAPEVIEVLLGPAWLESAQVFQVFGLGMLLRVQYKNASVLARAMGALKSHVWRQVAYAVGVLAGAFIGTRWGITGVAWGVMAALVTNYLLMCDLGLRLTKIGWAEFFSVQRPGFFLALAVGVSAFLTVSWARAAGIHPALSLVLTSAVASLGAGALAWLAPSQLLGSEGLWWVGLVRGRLQSRSNPIP